ncbi:hypothetical protein IWW57_005095 [Coemansia sp. S610]|nr:hypothetical protein IWW57_005095 [Coemansia sp. S610]KAJ2380546.1 hypothetical protein H4S02_006631 [Coemansia sp. RSA 2611]KAJ2701628.1 hypothetical protein H4218_001340 [Coemansia sp. IMI 209128]
MKVAINSLLIAAVAATVSAEVWKITSLDKGTRENTCSRQVQACQNNCGGPTLAPMAFCNATTMAWGCGCKNNTPNMEVWNWPVPAADCSGSLNVCKNNCSTKNNTSECFINCTKTHMCNTEDAPVSYTSSSDIAVEPKYVGPAVSYKGDKLGDLNDGNNRDNLSPSSSGTSDPKTASDGSHKSTTDDDSSATRLQLAGTAVFAALAAALSF